MTDSSLAPELAATPQTVAEEEPAGEGIFSLRGMLRLLVASGPGRAGIALFALLLAISAYVLITYPSDFGRARWSSPAVWADNPRAAPPVWTNWFGGEREVVHEKQVLSAPSEVVQGPNAERRSYNFPISYDADAFPTFLSTTLTGITFQARAPFVTATLVRPDGAELRLGNIVVPGPRPEETAPYRRFYDTPERLLLSSQETAARSLSDAYATLYPGVPAPANLQDNLAAGLFARPAEDGSGTLTPLHGDYTLQVQVVVADPKDEVADVEMVLGGTVYGVMGTDTLGRDLWEGLLYGFPIALLIATTTSILVTIIGAGLGIISGYAGGATDTIIQRLADIVSNVPTLPLLIFLVFIFGSHLYLILLVLVAFSWTGLTILVRSMVLQLRSGQLVEAAHALGASRWRIMLRHVFPQVAPFIVATMIFSAPGAILAETALSFLGLGDVSVPTWGQMLQSGFQTGAVYVGYWWWIIPPGVMIIITALAFMLLALALEPIVDPRLRRMS
jgi:peptide/nickel transport system permease protein